VPIREVRETLRSDLQIVRSPDFALGEDGMTDAATRGIRDLTLL